MTPSSVSWARWRDTVLLGCPVAAASVRTEGKHRPVRSANATRFCSVQCRCRRTVRYRSMVTGTNDSKRASGVAAQPARKRHASGALFRCTPKGLAKIGEVGEAHDCQIDEFPRPRRYARPALRGGFCYFGVLV